MCGSMLKIDVGLAYVKGCVCGWYNILTVDGICCVCIYYWFKKGVLMLSFGYQFLSVCYI
jgi:hypothetical protein